MEKQISLFPFFITVKYTYYHQQDPIGTAGIYTVYIKADWKMLDDPHDCCTHTNGLDARAREREGRIYLIIHII